MRNTRPIFYTLACGRLADREILPKVENGQASVPANDPLLEPEALDFLEQRGFPFPKHRFITAEDQVPPRP